MAVLYPKTKPATLYKGVDLKAERAVHDILARLPEPYQVFCNPRANLKEQVEPLDRAIDFIILHPKRGILVIDVKGGEIVKEQNGYLSQYQASRKYYKIIEPVKQAQAALDALLDKCDRRFRTIIPVCIAVFFPDTARATFNQTENIYFFSEDLASMRLRARLEMLFPYPYQKYANPTFTADMEKLAEFLKIHSVVANSGKKQRPGSKPGMATKRTAAQKIPLHYWLLGLLAGIALMGLSYWLFHRLGSQLG